MRVASCMVAVAVAFSMLAGCAYQTVQDTVKKPKATYPYTLTPKQRVLKALETRAKEVKHHPEAAVAMLPTVSVNLEKPTLGLLARILARESGWRIVYPLSMTETRSPVNFVCDECSLGDVLKRAMQVFDLAADVNYERRVITLKNVVSKTFTVPIMNAYMEIDNEIELDETENSGTGSSSGFSVSGTATSSSPEADLDVKEKMQGKPRLWEDIVRHVKEIVGDKGTVFANEMISAITVTAPPSVVRKVQHFISTIDRIMSAEVRFDITIYEVQLSREYDQGIDWSKLFRMDTHNLLVRGGQQISSPFVTALLTSTRSNNRLLVQLLSQFGKVRVLTEPHVVLQNGHVTFFSSGQVIPYVRTVKREYTGGTEQELIIPEMAETHAGITFTLTCRVMMDGRVLMSITPVLTTLTGWRNCQFRDIAYSNPMLMKRTLVTRAIVEDGRTLIIGGIIYDVFRRSRTGTGVLPIDWALSARRGESTRVELVLAVTPHVVYTSDVGKVAADDGFFEVSGKM